MSLLQPEGKVKNMFKKIVVFLLILFSISGALKWIPFPVDPTLLFGSLTILFTLIFALKFNYSEFKMFNKVLLFFFIFHFLYLSTSAYTQSEKYYIEKIMRVLLNVSIFFAPIFLLTKKEDFKTFFQITYLLHITLFFILCYNYWVDKFELLLYGFEEEGSKVPSYQVVSIILGLFVVLHADKKKLQSVILNSLSVIFIFMLSSKGTILFLILVALIKYYNQKKINLKRLFSVLIIVSVPIYLYSELIIEKLMARIFVGNEFSEDVSSQTRLLLFEKARLLLEENPFFGIGIGGFGIQETGLDERLAPHNVIMEVFLETGIVGGIAFLFLIYVIFKFIRKSKSVEDKSINFDFLKNALFFLFCVDMVSGFIEDIRLSYFMVGVVLSYIIFQERVKKSYLICAEFRG